MLPSKVMPYLFRLAAPLMDSSIVQTSNNKDGRHQQDWPHLLNLTSISDLFNNKFNNKDRRLVT
jgi:hypothetical protein